jgi:hypothetical protein
MREILIAIKKCAFDKKQFEIAGSEFTANDAKQFEIEFNLLLENEYKRGFSNGLHAAKNEIVNKFGL